VMSGMSITPEADERTDGSGTMPAVASPAGT
jgi:hypothetical protein